MALLIARTEKIPRNTLTQVADLILENKPYLNDHFPQCGKREELLRDLAKSHQPWSALSLDRPVAFFRLHMSESVAVLDEFLPLSDLSFEELIRHLKNDIGKMQANILQVRIPDEMIEAFAKNGFQKTRVMSRMSGPIVETRLMPMLRINNPTRNDIPALAKLMQESYDKSVDGKLKNLNSAETALRGIMADEFGKYVQEASFMSGTQENIVSACLVTLHSPLQANVAELFTHPLYRARALATTELATSMNKLAKLNVHTLTMWISEANDVARRLVTKLGFRHDRKLTEMSTNLP